jgi:hypothetical protein
VFYFGTKSVVGTEVVIALKPPSISEKFLKPRACNIEANHATVRPRNEDKRLFRVDIIHSLMLAKALL